MDDGRYSFRYRLDITARANWFNGFSESGLPADASATLLDNLINGVAYCRMVFDGDRPTDFVYLYTNPAFHTQHRPGRSGG